jgi:iron complex transport system permease protein
MLRRLWLPLLLLLCVVAFIASLCAGSLAIDATEVFSIVCGGGDNQIHRTIVMHIRLPRVILAALVGMTLSISGCSFQAVLRNPLADPYILGVSGGAALGAVIALYLGVASPVSVPFAAFCGALAALAMVYWVARAQESSTHTLILSGVMVGSLCSALLLFLLWLTPDDPLRTAIFWLAGNFALADTTGIWWIAGVIAVASLALWLQAPALDLFTQDEQSAADLGLAVGRSRLIIFALAGLLTAISVALAGLVGFVGLTVPHIMRLLLGPQHLRLLPASALAGALFLMSADTVSRTLLAPAEIPIGVVTALIGAPFFLFLMRKERGGI